MPWKKLLAWATGQIDEALRDAIEDFECLAVLQRLGEASQAEQVAPRLAQTWSQ